MKDPYKIINAEGVYLYTEDQKLIDSVSSWWCMIHGYKNPEITEAIKNQADQFSHVMLGGLTHKPVQKLAAKLLKQGNRAVPLYFMRSLIMLCAFARITLCAVTFSVRLL